MEYFGTNIREAGHYRWNIDDGFLKMNYRFEELSFNPENLTNNLPKGKVVFYQGGGFTVLGIAGSCIDNRPGAKSIFWVKEIISRAEIIERIKANSIASEIISSMPFTVNW